MATLQSTAIAVSIGDPFHMALKLFMNKEHNKGLAVSTIDFPTKGFKIGVSTNP